MELYCFPSVETLNELVSRTQEAVAFMAEAHPGEIVLAYAHSRIINALIEDTEDMATCNPVLPNCAVVGHFSYCHETPDHPLKFLRIENLLHEESHHGLQSFSSPR